MNGKIFIISVVGIIGITLSMVYLVPELIKLMSVRKGPPPQKIVTQPNIYPFPTGDKCLTSQASGSAAKKVYKVSNLKSDGKTNNAESIQKAIDDAAEKGGGIVKMPTGTFLIDAPIVMKDNITFEGVGSNTVLKASPKMLDNTEKTGYSIVTTKGASNVTIQHFTADQQGNVLDGNKINRFLGYVIHAHNSTNVVVNDVSTRNPYAYAIVAEDSEHFCFKNNNTRIGTSGKYDQLDGMHVLNSSYGDVLLNIVDQGSGKDGDDALVAHTIDGTVHDVTYAGNRVRGGQGGAGMQLALTNTTDTIYNIKIQNNEFWGSPRGIRTGYYGEPGGSVHDVVIGGAPKSGNYIHDNIFGNYNPGDVINIYGNGDDPYNITVSYNKSCKAGKIVVGTGENNISELNSDCGKK